MNASAVATIAMLLVVPLTLAAFASWRITIAALVILFAGEMFLPELISFDYPLVPPINKHRMATFSVFVATCIFGSKRFGKAELFHPIDRVLLVLLLLDVGTVLTNLDPLQYGPTHIQGHTIGEIPSKMIATFLDVIVPFVLGRILFRARADVQDLLRCIAGIGLAYVPFILVEMFTGPTFHLWVYGYQHTSVEQAVRGSMFRPTVFMYHGLAVAIFMYIVTSCSAIVAKSTNASVLGIPARVLAVFYVLLFPFLQSSAALVYALATVPLVVFTKPKTQVRVAAIIASCVLIYQFLRVSELVNIWTTTDLISKVFGPDRAQSLGFRFGNEELICRKALQRPLFGWGGFGRERVYNAQGFDTTITDGFWVIVLGTGGILGSVASFSLLCGPVFLAKRMLPRIAPEAQRAAAGFSLILAFAVADLLPNGLFNAIPYFLAGAVTGLALGLPKDSGNRRLPMLIALYLWNRIRSQRAPTASGAPKIRARTS